MKKASGCPRRFLALETAATLHSLSCDLPTRHPLVVEVDTVGSASVFLTAPCPLTANFCSEPCTAQSRHSSLRRVLVLPGGMPLLHETSSTATHHPLPNGLPVIDLHKTKPVCACAAQHPLNASASTLGFSAYPKSTNSCAHRVGACILPTVLALQNKTGPHSAPASETSLRRKHRKFWHPHTHGGSRRVRTSIHKFECCSPGDPEIPGVFGIYIISLTCRV